MPLSITTVARNRRLTTVDRVTTVTGITVSSDEIDEASAAVCSHCQRVFARELVVETVPAFGDIHLQLSRTPIASVTSVTDNGSTITDYSIAEANLGWLYRQAGWAWTAQTFPGLAGGGRFIDYGTPLPRQEEALYAVTYVGGYFVRDDDVQGVGITASAADNSFNDASSRFPTLLKSGDIIETAGFSAAANNGRFVVSGTPTAAKIIVSATLSADADATSERIVRVRSLPEDIERATIETVKSIYLQRSGDSTVIEKQMGPARVRYSESGVMGVPPLAASLLRKYVRAA